MQNNASYFDINFDENNEPSFANSELIISDLYNLPTIENIELSITKLGNSDQIPIITTLSANPTRRCRWVCIQGVWRRVCSASYILSFNQNWEATLFDEYHNLVEAETNNPEENEYIKILSIDFINIVEVFGSNKIIIKIKDRWHVINNPE